MCFTLFTVTSNSQHPKNYKNENLGSKMEVDARFNCPRFKRQTNRVDKSWYAFWIYSNTVAEELVSSENIAR